MDGTSDVDGGLTPRAMFERELHYQNMEKTSNTDTTPLASARGDPQSSGPASSGQDQGRTPLLSDLESGGGGVVSDDSTLRGYQSGGSYEGMGKGVHGRSVTSDSIHATGGGLSSMVQDSGHGEGKSSDGDDDGLEPAETRHLSRSHKLFFMFLCTALIVSVITIMVKYKNEDTDDADLQDQYYLKEAHSILSKYPLINGHNDLPWALRELYGDNIRATNLSNTVPDLQTDIPRLRKGQVGGEFWSVYVPCVAQYKDAVRMTMEQIDITRRMIDLYPGDFEFADTADSVEAAFAAGKIASLMGMEGGHSIDSSMGALRQFYGMGVRYMTLTHSCSTPWADSCAVKAVHNGLTDFGKRVVREMNRIGMMVDISHVAPVTMQAVLNVTAAPVIFSHSSAYALCNNPRNVPDNILKQLPANGGVVMVNFYPEFINCSKNATIEQVADHIDYIKGEASSDNVGLGSDFDGIPNGPVGLENPSKYPELVDVLLTRGWTQDDVVKLIGGNILRVMRAVEAVAKQMSTVAPDPTLIGNAPPIPQDKCRTNLTIKK